MLEAASRFRRSYSIALILPHKWFVKKEFTLTLPRKSLPTRDLPSTEEKQEDRGHLWLEEALRFLRFGLVGGLNTILDLLVFNALLWILPTRDIRMLLIYNSIAYTIGGINSFLLNKYWTFRYRQYTTLKEIIRFMMITMLGVLCNDALIWLTGSLFHPLAANTRLWANLSKLIAVGGTALISYLGMRLWVFIKSIP